MNVFTAQNFIVVQATLVTLGIAFLVWKRPKKGLRLYMKNPRRHVARLGPEMMKNAVVHQKDRAGRMTVAASGAAPMKSLNVYFNYNGHSWDAFEVLGLPAGSSWDRVCSNFDQAVDQADETSRPFLQAALRAIEAHVKSG